MIIPHNASNGGHSPPLSGQPWYPIFLDLIDSCLTAKSSIALFETTRHALAPTWKDLSELRIDVTGSREPQIDDLGASDEAPIVQHKLACDAARVVAKLKFKHPIRIHSIEYWDETSLVFLDRLLKEPNHPPIEFDFDAVKARLDQNMDNNPLTSDLANFWPTPSGTITEADRYLSLCPHGLPISALKSLCSERSELSYKFLGATGEESLILPANLCKEISSNLAKSEQARMHGEIFDALPSDGWGYIRKGGHATRSQDPSRMKQHYSVCIAGLMHIGYEFVYDHLNAMALQMKDESFIAVNLGAARLAPRLPRQGGRELAKHHYLAALEKQDSHAAQISTLHEIANLLASSRSSEDNIGARAFYNQAFDQLEKLKAGPERDDLEIRLRNGVALLDYKAGDADRALDHEKKALLIAKRNASLDDKYSRWSEPLLRTNTSKLLFRLFDDVDGAVEQLQLIDDKSDSRTKFSKMQNLGRMHFELKNYRSAATCLEFCLDENNQPINYSESEELFDICAYTISSRILGSEILNKNLVGRMSYLSAMNNNSETQAWIESLCLVLNGSDDIESLRVGSLQV